MANKRGKVVTYYTDFLLIKSQLTLNSLSREVT